MYSYISYLYAITITQSGQLECTPRWLLSMEETAQLLGVSRTMIWELSKHDDFPSFRIGRRVCIRVASLLAWISLKEQPEREPPVTPSAASKKKKNREAGNEKSP